MQRAIHQYSSMAKFEEADPRWKVQDLGEKGRNVNNWWVPLSVFLLRSKPSLVLQQHVLMPGFAGIGLKMIVSLGSRNSLASHLKVYKISFFINY